MTPRDDAQLFWEHHYHTRSTGAERANPVLVETAEPLPPGAALDLGCGAGGDTIWLARHGWQVTAVADERIEVRQRETC
jgi:2-polyprenyl-3-methyl-5-hydroxy-6-metoxy-1,4-benzoquinol methylase